MNFSGTKISGPTNKTRTIDKDKDEDGSCCLFGILGPHYANGATTIENIYIFTCEPLKILKNNSGKRKGKDGDESVDISRELV